MNYWLVKSDPDTYSWETFISEGKAMWDGVRNYQARNNLKLMKLNDTVLFYHSVASPAVVGIAKVSREYYADPTAAAGEQWVVVDLIPNKEFEKSVTLEQIRNEKDLQSIALIKQPRLSVMPLTRTEYETIVKKSK